MRDYLIIEEKCREGIEYNKEFIQENKEDIKSLEEGEKKGIQRYSKDNNSIIEGTYLSSFNYELEDIIAKYSLGEAIHTIEGDFDNALIDLRHIGENEVGYLNLIWMISLGILLETEKKNLVSLAKLVEKENMNDAVIDFLLCASDIGYTKMTNVYFKENPYAKTREIIELAQADKKEASKRLQTYMEKEWFKGHYDYEWKNAHKEPGYVGTIVAEVGTGGLASPIVIPLDIAATATGASLFVHGGFVWDKSIQNAKDTLQRIESSGGGKGTGDGGQGASVAGNIGKNDKLASQGHVDAGVSGAPKVDAGKQGKHVPGHGNNVSTKSQWGAGKNGVVETQEAWVKGTPVKPDGSVRVHDFGKPIGPNGETRVKVHMDGKGNIHGYPVQ